jgi:phosphoribosylformylglycinamidine (FGAM) synthase-like amidotransferase family enzyme
LGGPLGGTIIFSGTMAALTGGFVYGDALHAELVDSQLNRRLALAYDIHSLEEFT